MLYNKSSQTNSFNLLEGIILKIIIYIIPVFSYNQLFCQDQDFNNTNSSPEAIYRNARLYVDQLTNGGRQFAIAAKATALLEIGKKGNSGFRLYFSGALAKNFSSNSLGTILNYQLDLVLFTDGIGSSILPSERDRLNIEIRNNIGFVIGVNDNNEKAIWGRPLIPTIGDADSVLEDPLDFSFQTGTVFVTGINHKRSQQLGFFKLGLAWFNIFYMNDGPPFGKIGLGDTWDRYWTGVGGIGYHRITEHGEITSFEIRYSRYTDDEPFLYDLSSDLRMNYLPHKDNKVQFFNKGRYQYRVGFRNSVFLGVNIYQPKITDVQRIIHHGVWAFHTNPTDRYFTYFGQYSFKNIYLKD